jgi:aquaporin Z
MSQRFTAELLGTFALVFFAVGSAVFGLTSIGPYGVALAFGVILLRWPTRSARSAGATSIRR